MISGNRWTLIRFKYYFIILQILIKTGTDDDNDVTDVDGENKNRLHF